MRTFFIVATLGLGVGALRETMRAVQDDDTNDNVSASNPHVLVALYLALLAVIAMWQIVELRSLRPPVAPMCSVGDEGGELDLSQISADSLLSAKKSRVAVVTPPTPKIVIQQ